jgi:hypothetical protein
MDNKLLCTEGKIEMVRSSDNSRWQIKAIDTDKLPGLVLFEHTYDGNQAKANAQRIVTAWNSHDELVEALVAASQRLQVWSESDSWDDQDEAASNKIETALSKIKP